MIILRLRLNRRNQPLAGIERTFLKKLAIMFHLEQNGRNILLRKETYVVWGRLPSKITFEGDSN